jgi:D-alanine--poly(phosphoribitol) ligase subunit 1
MEKLEFSPETLALHRSINLTAAPFQDRSVKALFEECAERHGSAVAVASQTEVLSYRELNGLANSLAARLRRANVSPGENVGVSASRSMELIIALLAVIKCGAAYLPFDPAWPDEILLSIFKNAHCRQLIVTDDHDVAKRCPRSVITHIDRNELRPGEADFPIDISGDAIAYINFTSGTTGQPKGVQIQHRGIVRLVTSPSFARLDEQTILLHASPATFDAATFEIWGALLNGGTCVLYPSRSLRLSGLKRVIRSQRVTCIFLTTALFNAVIDEDPDALNGLETILFGGEAYSDRHVRAAFNAYRSGRLVHVYGPTECTTFATYHPIDRMPEPLAELPIGRPIQNTTLYVVDNSRLCRPGEVGEILLGGPGLSPGYLEAGSVNQHGFSEFDIAGSHQRLYRTGDYGCLLESGDLIFRGRADDQVKVSGFRIELSHVARVLGENPEVSQGYVTMTDEASGEKALLAFITPQSGDVDSEQVRNDLALRLPAYMIPRFIYRCGELPLLSSGKVDRRALLALHENRTNLP